MKENILYGASGAYMLLYDMIRVSFTGKRAVGVMMEGEKAQPYTIFNSSPDESGKDILLEVQTEDGRIHKISCLAHLWDSLDLRQRPFAQPQPSRTPSSQ